MIRLGAVAMTAVLLSACAVSTPDSIEGHWTVVEYTVDGETQKVVEGKNTRNQPYVELTSNSMEANAGCNHLWGFYNYEEGNLELGAGGTLMWCGDNEGSLMRVEFLFMQIMTGDPLTVTQQGNRMTWTGPDISFTLRKGKP